MANNLVDLKLLNTAYGINKKRIDNLSEKISTKTLIVGDTTTEGKLTVNSGTLNTDSLTVTGGMTVNGVGVTIPENKTLSLNGGGSVKGNTTLNALTGSVKFGNASDSNGNVTGSAQIIVPEGKSLSLSGSAITNANTTIEGAINASTSNAPSISGTLSATDTKTTSNTTITGTVKASTTSAPFVSGTLNATNTKTTSDTTITGTIASADITASGSAVLNESTIESATIQNGTINLNSKTLTVSSDSTITNTTSGSTITLEGVGAIDAKSMTLTTSSGASLNINNTLGDSNPDSGTAVACNGGIRAAKVYNAVWNDLADSIEVPQDTELEYGYCYKYKDEKVYKTDEYADPDVLGIHSDTAGMVLGIKPTHIKCINLAVAGVVLAYVDNEYECGTPLVATKEGKLTKANKMTRVLHPERIVATYFRKENNDFWGPSSNKIAVNGRSWVKVK